MLRATGGPTTTTTWVSDTIRIQTGLGKCDNFRGAVLQILGVVSATRSHISGRPDYKLTLTRVQAGIIKWPSLIFGKGNIQAAWPGSRRL